MGEYWKAVNIDKRQQINPHHLGDGLKYREWVANPSSGTHRAIQRLLEDGEWDDTDEVRAVSDCGGSLHISGIETDRPADYDDEWADAPGTEDDEDEDWWGI